jgi:hypothetical protein
LITGPQRVISLSMRARKASGDEPTGGISEQSVPLRLIAELELTERSKAGR